MTRPDPPPPPGAHTGIRHKLVNALEAWHPSDASAALLLGPWRRVFAPADWEALTQRSIVPKLAQALAQLVVNPAAQVRRALGVLGRGGACWGGGGGRGEHGR